MVMLKSILEFFEDVRDSFLFGREMRKPKEERDEEYLGVLSFGSKERYQNYKGNLKNDFLFGIVV